MSEPLLVVEPRGHANRELARLDADRLRTESDIRNALERSGRRTRGLADDELDRAVKGIRRSCEIIPQPRPPPSPR